MEKCLLIKKYLSTGDALCINAEGNSMFPFFRKKVELLVADVPLVIGCCVFASSNIFGYRVHRLIQIKSDGHYLLKGDGNGWAEREWITDTNIIGVIVGFYKKQQLYLYPIDGKFYKCFITLMSKLSRVHAKTTSVILRMQNKGYKVTVLVVLYKSVYFSAMYILSFIINHLLAHKS